MKAQNSHNKDSISIVIPVKDEERSIAIVIDEINRYKQKLLNLNNVSSVELIVVDDGSKDGTDNLVSSYNNVKLIRLPKRLGYGGALKIGFQNSTGNILAFLDGDNTYPAENILDLYNELIKYNAQMVIASRLSAKNNNMPLLRLIGNKIFVFVLNWLSNSHLKDATSGMRMFKKDILSLLYPLPDGLNFSVAMTAKALYNNLAIKELPISYKRRIGASKLNIVKDGLVFFHSIIYISSLYSPIKLFSVLGIGFILIGLSFCIAPLNHYLSTKTVPDYYIYRFLFILFMFIDGFNLVLFGILSNLSRNRLTKRNFSSLYINMSAVLLFLIGIGINYTGIAEYIGTGEIHTPWIRPLIGIILFFATIQLFIFNLYAKAILKK